MKKAFLSITVLLFFAISATAQVSAVENEKAKAYIKQAKEYASQQELDLAAEFLQKAYDINPGMLGCKEIQLLGMSYYMMEDSPSAIKFLELAAKCETEKKGLTNIYTHLGYSYEDMGDMAKAIGHLEKAISYSTDNKEIAVIYEQMANMHFDNEQGAKTIERMKQAVNHYLKHLSVTEDDVMRGSVKNEELGKKYFSLSWFASALNLSTEMRDAVVKSALTGNKDAIGFCKENGISYRNAIVLPNSSSEQDKAATALIEQAVVHASKKEYTSLISKLEKAYNMSPATFDGKTFYLLGLGYSTKEKYRSAIKYLEMALHYSLDKKCLYQVYSTLGYAYNMVKDYNNAEINAERALYMSDNDEEVLECSLRLASIYYAQKDYSGTIESYENAIRYYMRIHSITNAAVMKGKVKDKFLADTHMKLTILLNDAMRGDESDHHLQKAALCGSESAIEVFKKNGVKSEE